MQDGEETVGQALLIAAIAVGVLSATSLAERVASGMETLIAALH